MCPIKGLTDNIRPRLVRLGKIRLGVKEPSKSGKSEYPRPVDYFVLPPIEETNGPVALAEFLSEEKPRELDIVLPSDDVDSFAQTWYKAYSYTLGCICRGNGETAVRKVDINAVVDKETGELPDDLHPQFWPFANRESKRVQDCQIMCPGEDCPDYNDKPPRCRRIMNLQFMIPSYPELGVWQIDTSSIISIKNILTSTAQIRQLLGGNRVSMIPFKLRIVPQVVTPDQVGRKTVHVLQLNFPYSLNELFARAALPPSRAILPEIPDDEIPTDHYLQEPGEARVVEAAPRRRRAAQPEPTNEVEPAQASIAETPTYEEQARGKETPNTLEPPEEPSAPIRETPVRQEPLPESRRSLAWTNIQSMLRGFSSVVHNDAARWLAQRTKQQVGVKDVDSETAPDFLSDEVIGELEQRLLEFKAKQASR